MDALDAAEAAIFAALDGHVSAPVYQHVAEDTPAPFVMIGELSDQPLDTKGDGDSLIAAQVSAVFEGEQRKPLIGLLGEIRAALDGLTETRGGWELHVRWLSRTASRHPERAQVYVGLATFEITALAE